jgi:hypothetical protein
MGAWIEVKMAFTLSLPVEMVVTRSICMRRTEEYLRTTSSSCMTYEGEWFLSGQFRSQGRLTLDQTPRIFFKIVKKPC